MSSNRRVGAPKELQPQQTMFYNIVSETHACTSTARLYTTHAMKVSYIAYRYSLKSDLTLDVAQVLLTWTAYASHTCPYARGAVFNYGSGWRDTLGVEKWTCSLSTNTTPTSAWATLRSTSPWLSTCMQCNDEGKNCPKSPYRLAPIKPMSIEICEHPISAAFR
jgi:hypothetical protein